MEFDVKESGTWRKEVTVKVPSAEIEEKRVGILRELRTNAAVPGFRIGHTPFEILELRFADELGDQLKSKVITEAVSEVIEKGELKPVSVPDVNTDEIEVKRNEDLSFSFTVEVRPEFELPDYKSISIEKPKVEVTEEDIDRALEVLLERFSEFRSSDEAAGPGDMVVCDYTIKVGKEVKKDEKEAALGIPQSDDDKTLVGTAPYPIPRNALEGVKAGKSKQKTVTLKKDFPEEALRGKKATFKAKVLEVRKRQLPELNDAFAKQIGADDIETLRTNVRRRIAREREAEAERQMREGIIDELIKAAGFDLPKDLLESHSKYVEARSALNLARMGVTQEQLQERKEELAKASAESAEKDLRKTFIFSAIAETEEIEVDEAEVEERIEMLARYWNTTPVAARSRLRESGGLSSIYEDILEQKVLDFLVENMEKGWPEKAESKEEKAADPDAAGKEE